MAEKQKYPEGWRVFIRTRFIPNFWHDIKARLFTQLLGVVTAVLILLAQLHYGVITTGVHPRILSILWPYLVLFLTFVVYHLARTPWLISNEHLNKIAELKETISEKDQKIKLHEDMIHGLSIKPKRSPAEQHYYDIIQKTLKMRPEIMTKALGHILKLRSLTFGNMVSPTLPPGLKLEDAQWAYNHCLSEGIVKDETDIRGNRTYKVSEAMIRALEECLFPG